MFFDAKRPKRIVEAGYTEPVADVCEEEDGNEEKAIRMRKDEGESEQRKPENRKDAQYAPGVERSEIRIGAACFEKDARDEVAGEDEEQFYSQPTLSSEREDSMKDTVAAGRHQILLGRVLVEIRGMVQDDHSDCETADAVKLRDPGEYFAFILHSPSYLVEQREGGRKREQSIASSLCLF